MRCPSCDRECSGRTAVCPSCGADLGDPGKDPLIGKVIDGKYQILALITEGGMGRIYRGTHMALDLEIAVKVIRPDLAANREAARRFFREARAAAKLSHPNSVNILDFGEAEGTLFLAMEFLRGRPLDTVLNETGAMPPERVVDIAVQVLNVLAAAHRLAIVHRDLKPENILVEQTAAGSDFVKVVDFGIAKITDPLRERDNKNLTQTGTILGTPAYMSPEQILARPVDSRSDFYSLGVVCYEMLTLQTPFSGSIGELLKAHLNETPAPVASLRPDLPPALAAVIDGVLAKDPAARPQTAPEFARQLQEALQSSGVPAAVASGPSGPHCSRCHAIAEVGATICAECGAALGEAASPGGDRFGDLRRHLPDGVVDAVAAIEEPDRSRRDLVAMVFDLWSDDPRAESVVTEVTDELARIAGDSGGWLEFRPDGSAQVTFGIERSLADDVERAVRAAVEMRESISARRARTGVDFALTAALHTGPALIAPDGALEPVGDLYQLPLRLLPTADAGQVVVSEAVRSRLGRWARARRMTPAPVAGTSSAVARHEILGIADGSTEVVQTIRTPLVGRDDEIEQLVAMARKGGVIDVDGEVGIGKSRVLEGLKGALIEAGAVVVEAGWPNATDSMLQTFERHGGLGACGLRDDQLELLRRWKAGDKLATSGHQLDVAIAATLREALIGYAANRPTILLVDGLERARPVVGELVRQLAARLPPHIVVIAASRTGYRRPWERLDAPPEVKSLTLGPLDAASISAMVDGMFAAAARVIGLRPSAAPTLVPRWIRELVINHAGGSPLMAVEVIGALIDAGAIAPSGDGGWELAPEPIEIPLARNFDALIAQRIDRLDAHQRQLCGVLAVAGGKASHTRLTAIVGRSITAELDQLVLHQLLVADGGNVAFAADSTTHVVVDRLSEAEQRQLHAAMAGQLAQSSGADPEEIARHYAAAGRWEQAIEQLERAAHQASARDKVAAIWTHATDLADMLHEKRGDPQSARRVCSLGLRAAEAWHAVGDLKSLQTTGERIAKRAAETGDELMVARANRVRAVLALATGDPDTAARLLDEVIAAALAQRDTQLYAEAHADLGEVHEKRGELETASECLVRSLELAQRGSTEEVRRLSLRVLMALARVLLRKNAVRKAFELLQQAFELARALEDFAAMARALGNMAAAYHSVGDLPHAIETANRSLDVSRRCGDQIGEARQLTNLGTLHLGQGETDSAAERFDEAYQVAARVGWREGMASAAAGRDRVLAATKQNP